MTATIYNIRDYQNPKDLARMYGEQSLEQQANAILAGALSGVFLDFSLANAYHAPDKDPA